MTDPYLASYDAMFRRWGEEVAAAYAAAKPHLPPYPLDKFDGCSGVPDRARHCCLCHDIRYFYVETPADRLEADLLLRACLIAMGQLDPAYRWLWKIHGWLFFLGVRCFGWLFAGQGTRALKTETPR